MVDALAKSLGIVSTCLEILPALEIATSLLGWSCLAFGILVKEPLKPPRPPLPLPLFWPRLPPCPPRPLSIEQSVKGVGAPGGIDKLQQYSTGIGLAAAAASHRHYHCA